MENHRGARSQEAHAKKSASAILTHMHAVCCTALYDPTVPVSSAHGVRARVCHLTHCVRPCLSQPLAMSGQQSRDRGAQQSIASGHLLSVAVGVALSTGSWRVPLAGAPTRRYRHDQRYESHCTRVTASRENWRFLATPGPHWYQTICRSHGPIAAVSLRANKVQTSCWGGVGAGMHMPTRQLHATARDGEGRIHH